VPVAPEDEDAASRVAELAKRHAALRQAAGLPAADLGALLDAAFTELEEAIGLLTAPLAGRGRPDDGRSADADGAERRMLRAAFTEAPVPLFLLARDGTVLRVNKSAGQLLGSRPGYATGRSFTTFVALQSRAAVQTQLNAVARHGRAGRIRCGLLGSAGPAPRDLLIGLVTVNGDSDRLMVAVADRAVRSGQDEDQARPLPKDARASGRDAAVGKQRPGDAEHQAGGAGTAGAVEAITQRMDLVTAVTRLLLENESFSESMTLQRSARLLAGELAAWVSSGGSSSPGRRALAWPGSATRWRR
jgi:PAS fold